MARRPSKQSLSTGILVVLLAGVLVSQTLGASAEHLPADKVAVAGSGIDVTPAVNTVPNSTVDTTIENVLTAKVRVSTPSDLILGLTSECALWTNTATQGNDDQETIARVEYWITIDGHVVPVANDDIANPADQEAVTPDQRADRGRVVFCNRATRQRTEMFNEGMNNENDEIIRLFNRTRDANAFNWAAMDVGVDNTAEAGQTPTGYDEAYNGNNIVDVAVHVRLVARIVCDPDPSVNPGNPQGTCAPTFVGQDGVTNPAARAGVGKRTLVIEPTHMAVHDVVAPAT